MKIIPKVSIVASIIALILDIFYIILGSNTLGSTGLNGSSFLRFGLNFSHVAIAMALTSNAYSMIRKTRMEYAGISMVISVIVFAAPAIIVYTMSILK